jgi:hypothetical protein
VDGTSRRFAMMETLSVDALEYLCSFLKDHNLIRLYLTGCQALQSKFLLIKRRSFDELPVVQGRPSADSDLITRLLIDTADDVTSEWRNIERLASPHLQTHPSRIAKLRLVNCITSRPTTNEFMAVLGRMPRLNTLDICDWDLNERIVFPSTITHLSLGLVDEETVKELLHLPLVHLGLMTSTSGVSSIDWMSNAKWFESLTSLSLRGRFILAEDLAKHLPRNLISLSLGYGEGLAHDLGVALSNQTSMQTLKTKSMWYIGSPLPPTLTDISIDSIVILGDIGLGKTMDFIPPSVSSLSIKGMSTRYLTDWSHRDISHSEFAAYATRFIPRLDLRSAIDIGGRYHRRCPVGWDTEEMATVDAALVQKLAQNGYGRRHIEWIKHSSSGSRTSEHDVDCIGRHGLTEGRDVALFLGDREKMKWVHCGCEHHYAANVKCLEWGFCDYFAVTYASPPDLGDDVLRRLAKIVITASSGDIVNAFLAKYKSFESVRTIVVNLPIAWKLQFGYVDDLIGTICKYRAKFPRLGKIVLRNWNFWHVNLSDESVQSLAKMRIRRVGETRLFRYTTALPPESPEIVDIE